MFGAGWTWKSSSFALGPVVLRCTGDSVHMQTQTSVYWPSDILIVSMGAFHK